MKGSTKVLFLRPMLIQESITAFIVVPMLVVIFMNFSQAVRDNLLDVAMGASAAAQLGLFLGCVVKFFLVRPAIQVMENESPDIKEVQRAVRKVAILPMAEAVTIFLRFALTGSLIAIVPLAVKGYITDSELLVGINTLIMTGLLVMPFFYLAAENSLVPFFQKCQMEGVLDSDVKFFRLSLNKKLLFTILLIAISPIGLILGIIYLSVVSGLDLSNMKVGFALIMVQITLMTFINGALITRSLTLSVGRMSVMFEAMAKGQGDLTKRLHVSGLHEVGQLAFWFNKFMEDMEVIIGHVMETSMQLHQAIQEVSCGSQDLSQATQEQAASVEEISASIDQMKSVITHSAGLVCEGKDTSGAVTKLIDHSKDLFSKLSTAIGEISRDSEKIGDIVSTVNEVAFHTNLLALNASVEAARAGEHGKGFAVVAGEVRSLAQRSAGAASEIKSLIESTVGRIKNGDEMMKRTSSSLEELMSRMEYFFRMMEVINVSSSEQSQNIGELSRAILQIDGSTQHNASTVEELASTLDNLRVMATVLAEDVKKFKTSHAHAVADMSW
jgi:methyl-accepting chemotaxis protein